jgi:hypothetical protein
MKKLFLLFIITVLIAIPASVFGLASLTSDDYAVEVVLNKPGIEYNLASFNNANNVAVRDNGFILQSKYSPNLGTILEEINGLACSQTSGLSIRLQIPVKMQEENVPYFKFVSTSIKGALNWTDEKSYNGWEVSCISGNPVPECVFTKQETTITVSRVASNRYEATIETTKKLGSCTSCDGKCIISQEPKCIDKSLKNDIEDILKHFKVISNFDEIVLSYRVVISGTRVIDVIVPEKSLDIDWKDALRQELSELRSDNVIAITMDDIEKISSLAEQGKAGANERITYCEDKNQESKWIYYSDTKSPVLTTTKNYREFPFSSIPTSMMSFSSGEISTYYLIPAIITSFLVVLFIILIVVARIVDNSSKKRHI